MTNIVAAFAKASMFGLLTAIFLSSSLPVVAQDEGEEAVSDAENSVFGASNVPDTLMFTIDELNDIQSRIAGGDVTEEVIRTEAIEQANLFLSSILYFSPKEWTIWINGLPISPNQEVDSFEVVGINSAHVEMIVPLSATGMRPVRLEPNQTFISQTGVILEGQWD
ncbi:MAG: hypothetical protein GKS03_11315 [Alphaproteobacteria bacterium]|nr:hypothetical protein [Alphaproteobacteria bacterium]